MTRQQTIDQLSQAVDRMGQVRRERDSLFEVQLSHPNPNRAKLERRRQVLSRKEDGLDRAIRDLTRALI